MGLIYDGIYPRIPTILVIFFLFSLKKVCMYIQDDGLRDYRDLKDLAMDCYYNGLVAITIVVRTRRSAQHCKPPVCASTNDKFLPQSHL